jgi:peptidoglycan/xylan/chitin deacetylase (PgdA/CDA1 family)
LRCILPDSTALFRNTGIVDVPGQGWQIAGANAGTDDRGRAALLTTQMGKGWCVVLPFDLTRLFANHACGPKRFYARASRFPYDTVADVSRGEVRRLVANSLRFLFSQKGLPYVRLSYVPGDLGSVFGFRVDTDFGPLTTLETVAELATRTGIPFSWYVNVGVHAEHMSRFREYSSAGQDIQLHCYRHLVYPDYERNRGNIERGKQAMADADIIPVGFVAPFGEWNPTLDQALTKLGFAYSSEFCFAYDDLPARPVVSGKPGAVLQVPVHPLCISRLLAVRAGRDELVGFFRRHIDLQAARMEPCFLYDHPERITEHRDVWEEILKYGPTTCGGSITLTDYARWWLRREQVSYLARADATGVSVECGHADDQCHLVIEHQGQYGRAEMVSGRIDYARLSWQDLPGPVPFEPAAAGTRRTSLRFMASSSARRVRYSLQKLRM